MIQLAIFDMAGTTVRDNKEVETCFRRAAEKTGLQMTAAEILSVQGWSKRYVFEEFWARQLGNRGEDWEMQVERSYQSFREILEEHYHQNDIQPTAGCLETFAFLRKNDIKIALTTGFYRKVANIILEKLGWLDGLNAQYIGDDDSLIQFSITSDEVANGRPAPDMIFAAMRALGVEDVQQVLNVGDTPSDLQSGKAAGVRLNLAVTNGTHSAAHLAPHPNDGLLSQLSDLIPMVEHLP